MKNSGIRTFHDISSRCLQEAVDKLFQRTLRCKIVHSITFKLPSKSYQKNDLHEITSLCIKVGLPPDASRKQLTNSCSTPSSNGAKGLHFRKKCLKNVYIPIICCILINKELQEPIWVWYWRKSRFLQKSHYHKAFFSIFCSSLQKMW